MPFVIGLAIVLYTGSYVYLREAGGGLAGYSYVHIDIAAMRPKKANSYGSDFYFHRFLERGYAPLAWLDRKLTGHRTEFYSYISEVDFSRPTDY